jgi:small subunit ribosomal protein S16
MSQQELLDRVIPVLDSIGIDYFITGSIASSRPQQRLSEDISGNAYLFSYNTLLSNFVGFNRSVRFGFSKGAIVAVRIRMKKMGRKHRPYFRIVAIDSRQPRDGRALEDLGTYDPMVKDKEKRVTLKPDRIKYWMSVGALPSEKLQVIFKKYMQKFEEAAQQAAAPPAPVPAPV